MVDIIILDNFFARSGANYSTDDTCACLYEHFNGAWPASAKIYHDNIREDCVVPMASPEDIENLRSLTGTLYVVVYPGDPFTAAVTAVVIAVVTVAAVMLLTPKISAAAAPSVANRNRTQASPNNDLADRVNQVRIGARIPDIYGRVRATPDLLAVPFKVFVDQVEIEYAYMCVGRGAYSVNGVYDDTTLLSDISGAGCEIYDPYTSPNSGDSPVYTVGSAIAEDLWSAQQCGGVNGQTLKPPNSSWIRSTAILRYVGPNEIQLLNDDDWDFQNMFTAGEQLVITMGVYSGRNLSGTYTISSIPSSTSILLSSPASVNSDWSGLGTIPYSHPSSIESNRENWIGPFTVRNAKDATYVYNNIVALNGLYTDDGTSIRAISVNVRVDIITELPTEDHWTFDFTIVGSSDSDRPARYLTAKCDLDVHAGLLDLLNTYGEFQVRMRRTSNHDINFSGTVIDEIKWRDAYTMTPVAYEDFGNVTTAYVATRATAGALAIKSRKFNMDVTRKLPERLIGTDNFSTELYATTSAAPILCAICLDPYIGRRTAAEIDVSNIYDTMEEVSAYFAGGLAAYDTEEMAQDFNYTFDKMELSFEETVSIVASAVFCSAYRQGSQIKLYFERETDDSVLLFNHRNKVPGSEKRTISFGYTNDYDGVEYTYVSPVDDSVITYRIPEDASAVNPKRIESIGVRHKLKAYWQAWREWNRIRYQRTAIEFICTREADILVNSNRILVADNTRPHTQDGEVVEQDGVILTLSQDVVLDNDREYTIFLQTVEGVVDNIRVHSHADAANKVRLTRLPRYDLSLSVDNYARATYNIVGTVEESRAQAFLLEEKNYDSMTTVAIRAVNYDKRYYGQDKDFILGLRDEDGNPVISSEVSYPELGILSIGIII